MTNIRYVFLLMFSARDDLASFVKIEPIHPLSLTRWVKVASSNQESRYVPGLNALDGGELFICRNTLSKGWKCFTLNLKWEVLFCVRQPSPQICQVGAILHVRDEVVGEVPLVGAQLAILLVGVDLAAPLVVEWVLQLAHGLGTWGVCGRGVHVFKISVLKAKTCRISKKDQYSPSTEGTRSIDWSDLASPEDQVVAQCQDEKKGEPAPKKQKVDF